MKYLLWILLFVLGQGTPDSGSSKTSFLSPSASLAVNKVRFLDRVFSGGDQDVMDRVKAIILQNKEEFLIHPGKDGHLEIYETEKLAGIGEA